MLDVTEWMKDGKRERYVLKRYTGIFNKHTCHMYTHQTKNCLCLNL